MSEQKLKTGTTTVGLKCNDSVILAADKRATAGGFIVDKNIKKAIKINDNIAVTVAGSVSEVQLIVKYLRAEIKLKELRTNRKITVKEAANLLAGMVYGAIRSYVPGVAHFLIAGYDTGLHLYDIFPDGSITEITDYVSSGSGSFFAYGVLEANYEDNLSQQQGVELVTKAINSSIRRDSASGNGINVLAITKDGVKEVLAKKIEATLLN